MLKAAPVALTLLTLLGAPALADTLVTGAIRDQAGFAAGGARVTALDAAGRDVGTDTAARDGTFAISARGAAAQVAITCDYCAPLRRAVLPGEPVIAIVTRYRAVTADGPSPDDIAALPYRSAADLAALRPFSVVGGGRISDRGLDIQGATLVSGLPFYRATDGNDSSGLVPAHAIATLSAASPLAAPLYGGYAAAGVEDVSLRDPDSATSRFDLGDASDVEARFESTTAGAGYAASSDTADDRQAASVDARLPFAGGRLSFDALDLVDITDHASGAGLSYATDSRRYSTGAALSATQNDGTSFIALDAHVRNRGPIGLEFGTRFARATSELDGASGAQTDDAVYAAAGRETAAGSLKAIVAWDRGGNAGIPGAAASAGLVGSLSGDRQLGARWTAHAGTVSNLRIPTFAQVNGAAPLTLAGDRSLLFEQSLEYTDLRRLRVKLIAYTQRSTGSATGHVNGIGIDAAWQIAPLLAARAWLLRANQSTVPAAYANQTTPAQAYDTSAYAAPAVTAAAAAPLTRSLLWLSYGSGLRLDALVRGGPLEGDVRVPCGGAYAFTLGTAVYAGRRVTTFGVTRR